MKMRNRVPFIICCVLLFGAVLYPGVAPAAWKATINAVRDDGSIDVTQAKVEIGIQTAASSTPYPGMAPTQTVNLFLYTADFGELLFNDFRADGGNKYVWLLNIHPRGNKPPPVTRTATMSWNPAEFGEGTYQLQEYVDGLGNDPVAVADMRTTTSIDVTGNADFLYTIVYTPQAAPVAPVAAFSGTPTSGDRDLTVQFTDQSTNNPTAWSWNFGDGGTSTAQNPSHTYTGAGVYTVTLSVSNTAGSDDETKTDYITVTEPVVAPVAAFSGTPTSGNRDLTVQFTDQSTNNPTTWSWNFGDGGTSTAQNPSHTYTGAGVYTVTLTASNTAGSDDETKTDYITVTEPVVAPVAAFSGTPTSGNRDLTVQFTDQSTNNPTTWSWSFGDGGTSTAQNPSHTYTAAGVYTVTLTSSNTAGSDDETKTDYITVTEPVVAPVAAFSGAPTSGMKDLTVQFTDQSTNNPTAWSWSFGDGGTSTAQNPSHTYTAAGVYTVTLTVSNATGSDGETKIDYITVGEQQVYHSADYNPADYYISLSELLRVIQFYNVGSYHCDPTGEDGYAPGVKDGAYTCTPHSSDYFVEGQSAQDWMITFPELLRLIQFYNWDYLMGSTNSYHVDPAGEDGFAPGDPPAGWFGR